jgi:hypothetical protein
MPEVILAISSYVKGPQNTRFTPKIGGFWGFLAKRAENAKAYGAWHLEPFLTYF